MIKKTLYFGNPAYLSLKDRQIVIRLPKADGVEDCKDSETIVTKPIEDVAYVVLDNNQITITQALLSAMLDCNVAVISCDSRGLPAGLMLPLDGNQSQSDKWQCQIEASIPLKKRLWQLTVQAKIINQAAVLKECTRCETGCMVKWASVVKSGDVDNQEARAAAYYWKRLFWDVKYFSRDRYGTPPNNLLNYGYAILRGVVARALVSSGLLPTFGIHHHNKYNAYCLADDVMEPYRPFVDELVYRIVEKDGIPPHELNREWKTKMLVIPTLDVTIGSRRMPLMVAVSQTTASLYRCYSGELRQILYPER